jgi:hypothetical protein
VAVHSSLLSDAALCAKLFDDESDSDVEVGMQQREGSSRQQ